MRKKVASADGLSQQGTLVLELRSRGYRITVLRRQLGLILEAAERPLSPPEIVKLLHARHFEVNKTSVYRELDSLKSAGLVFEFDLRDGAKRYELARGSPHHHHLICDKCGGITCAEICFDEKKIAKLAKHDYGFEVSDHVLDLYGLCSECKETAQERR